MLTRTPLPIDPLIPEILRCLRGGPNLVLEAPPGAGKTTRVPPALLSLGSGEVLVLEPRRLAARLASRRVAFETGERLGETVGYQVRFEEIAGPRTRLRYMTEGVLTRRLLSDASLRGVDAIVLDEFHERHLEGDLALALLRRLQKTVRPELRLIVMSATMDAAPVARFLGGARILRAEGRLFDLSVSYTPVSAAPLDDLVAAALDRLIREGLDGDVLAFLPGAAEIRRAMRACAAPAGRAGLLALPLHGDLPAEEQDRAVSPAERCKVIFSTNVAESSVTIEGVTAVIDSGLARVATDSPWSGLPALRVARVSRASADQRAGRAGRTGPGRVVRLYPLEDYLRRPEHETPDIARRELSQVALDLRAMGIGPLDAIEWLEPPGAAAVAAAEQLLVRLGAVDPRGALTDTGRRMARYPLHPRLARLVVEADRGGAGDGGCGVAALLSAGERLPADAPHAGPSDLLLLLDSDWSRQARRVYEQVRRVCRPARRARHDETALLLAILTAFPDRVARRRQGGELLLAGGGSAALAPTSAVHSDWLVAVDIEERKERGLPLVRLASKIEPGWLLDLFPDRVSERRGVEWNREAERAEAVSSLEYENLVIEESRGSAAGDKGASELLARKALEAGPARFADMDEIERFLARVEFATRHSPLPRLGEEDVRAALGSLCDGLWSFGELETAARSGGLLGALKQRLPPGASGRLDEIAPERIRLPGGRQVRVHYARGQAPWIASRLQDFFGMKETPRIAGGREPLVVHLLAPNQRPVQTTTDLAGFWERLYPQVRRELSRRYSKHFWPEKP